MKSLFSQYKNWIYFIISIVLLAYLLIEAQGEGDFHIYMSASKDLFTGENIYIKTYGDGFHYLYSIAFAIVLYPFSFLPFYLVKFLWLAFNFFLLWKTFKLLFSWFDLNSLNQKQLNWFYFLIILLVSRFIHENIHSGQITILILYLCIQGLNDIFNANQWKRGALLIAIGINIKLLPLVLLPYLIYRRKWNEFVLIIIIDAALWLLPAIFIGKAQNIFLMHEWWNCMNPNNKIHVLDVEERSFHGLTTLLSTLLIEKAPDPYALDLKRNILDVSLETLSKVILASRLILVSITLYFLRWPPFKNAISKSQQYLELSYILALIPLIFPHQQHYAFLFMLPAIIYLVYQLMCIQKSNFRNFLLISYIFIYLSGNLKLILGEFNPYYEHYKILTYGALWLLVVLIYLNRNLIKNEQPKIS